MITKLSRDHCEAVSRVVEEDRAFYKWRTVDVDSLIPPIRTLIGTIRPNQKLFLVQDEVTGPDIRAGVWTEAMDRKVEGFMVTENLWRGC